MSSMRRWHRDLHAMCNDLGIPVQIEQGGKHLKLKLPNGRIVAVPATPSDWRTMENIKTKVRQMNASRENRNE